MEKKVNPRSKVKAKTSERLALKWHNHHSTFFQFLSSIRSKESYSDATIACDGKFYPVHKLVLSTCSEYFEQIFERTQGLKEQSHPVIVLKDIKYDELEALMNYMYVGEVNVLEEKLAGLMSAAECLKIKGLAVPDEDPASVNKRNEVQKDSESPAPKRRCKGNVSKSVKRDKPTSKSSHDDRKGTHTESQDNVDSVYIESGIVDGEPSLNDQLTVQNIKSKTEQADRDQNEYHSKLTSAPQSSNLQPNPEASEGTVFSEIITETNIKSETLDIHEEDVDSKETLRVHLGLDPLSADGDPLAAHLGSVTSGSNDIPFTDPRLSELAPQRLETVFAETLPQSSNSFPLGAYTLAQKIRLSQSQSLSKARASEVTSHKRTCPICGDRSTGLHYGIHSCESCKGFFKRSVQNKKWYVCMRESDCIVTMETRGKCAACRFDKCLREGMKIEAIRGDRSRGGRYSYPTGPSYVPPGLTIPPGMSLDQARLADGAPSAMTILPEGVDGRPSSSMENPPGSQMLQVRTTD